VSARIAAAGFGPAVAQQYDFIGALDEGAQV